MTAEGLAAEFQGRPTETRLPHLRFADHAADLDIDFADPDRMGIACRVVAESLGIECTNVAGWTLDHRVRALAAITATTFGGTLAWQIHCPSPACRQPMELELSLYPYLSASAGAFKFECVPQAGIRLAVRLPTGLDQEAWRAFPILPEGLALAMAGSLVESLNGHAPEPGWRLPPKWLDEVEAQLAARDPCTVLEVSPECPSCSARSAIDFELEAVILEKLAREQRRAMEDVHRLARAYHWSEAEVLAIPPRRRSFYLERSDSER